MTRTMSRMALGAAIALGLTAGAGGVARADSALIQTTAPMLDSSEDAAKVALVAAVEKAVRGATAMGFAWVQLRGAQVRGQDVIVQILATDDEPDDMTEAAPDGQRSRSGGDAAGDRDPVRSPQGWTQL